jgi:type I restriction enzyme S subunit
LLPGDVLFTEGGDRDKLGRGWVWNGEILECIHQNHIFRARLKSDDIQGKLVSWFANLVGQTYFIDEGKQTVNLASINVRKLRAFPIPILSKDEQVQIVRRVDALFRLVSTIEQRVSAAALRADKLTQSILAKAFRGELVPTEAELARREGREYEPASVLLERIRAERADQSKTPLRPKRKMRRASAHV